MIDYEKLGVFYLGREHDLARNTPKDDLVLYDAKDLTTHALCVGMTGSGKTGLCLTLLEEAAIDGIPAIAIDPKGDIANLLLTFPDLSANDLEPWVDSDEATRRGITSHQLAEESAQRWRTGLAESGQDVGRIQRLRDACELSVYTPGSKYGQQLALLRSFEVPKSAVLEDSEAFAAKVESAVSALLSLVGVDADPVASREHVVLSKILADTWAAGKGLDLAGLVKGLAKPPFDQVGVLDLETFYPAKDRMALAMAINNLIASPAARIWAEGEALDVGRLLRTETGRPRIAIVSIAHLSDAQRMFFVTNLLAEVLAWTRSQSGTSSLRALLYMDEIAGYFPPTAAPPSKAPMLTLLKQARAFGVGVVLATQNPVDLDYKGLSNCGTWFIGRLQTERDKARVLDGLEGASAGRPFDRQQMERVLSALGSRVFLMNNVHEERPVIFRTRFTLSFLRGPLTKEQIKALSVAVPAPAPARSLDVQRPVLPSSVAEHFLVPSFEGPVTYRPSLAATVKLHYVSAKDRLDHWRELSVLLPLDPKDVEVPWSRAYEVENTLETETEPVADAKFLPTPAAITSVQRHAAWKKSLSAHAYQTYVLKRLQAPALKLSSVPGESRGEFLGRVQDLLRERRDEQVELLRSKFAPKREALVERRKRAQEKIEREKAEAAEKTLDTAFSLGSTILGAFFGRKTVSAANVGRAKSTAKSASRALKERQDIARAEETLESLKEAEDNLALELENAISDVTQKLDPRAVEITEDAVAAKKSDISTSELSLVWIPWRDGSPAARGLEKAV